ncbi:MAG TPA: DsbA family oxidoreductase [Pseudonocardiaceae bacterium]|nr:DsbA family oxidoreductase [Pseudonocardiaceae bacterium]
MKVEIYSDVACPWCYVGKVRFERALGAFPQAKDVEVTFRPFQLNPATPQEPQSLYEYYDQRFGPGFRDNHARISDVAAEEGLEFHMDRALAVNTFTAHRLLWLAEKHYGAQTQRDLKAALMRTYFSDGGNVNDTDTLVRLAEESGIDGETARTWLTSDEGTEGVRAELNQAHELGINSVPTFVFEGKWAVQGAQPTSAFLQVLEQVAAETKSSPAVSDGDGQACTDDSCAI